MYQQKRSPWLAVPSVRSLHGEVTAFQPFSQGPLAEEVTVRSPHVRRWGDVAFHPLEARVSPCLSGVLYNISDCSPFLTYLFDLLHSGGLVAIDFIL